ncbi:MAG: ATP-dependent DNA helicase RecG [Candidatus Gastranaerophilales bacterium]|nr:ATP-dependent DNA helicase RecG [Candidatus Gastranaerophilales bacterium]MCM1073402.1 ATP-dependent DNA helicase RecG [Bacteroides sp.]
MDNLEQVKKAVEIEVKHKYININGKSRNFSSFICSVLRKEIKLYPDNPKWKVLLEHFERYHMETVPSRKKSLERLVSVIKAQYLAPPEPEQPTEKKPFSGLDVMYIKGVGPKIAYMLNKLGIYTASDLLYYFPRKHIDYSTRTRIRDLEEGMTTTIFGTIKSVEAFTTKSNLGVIKVKIADGSGSINLSFFASKSSKFVLERMKSQFPKGSGIMVSGVVKLNSYDGRLTLDKPTYSIMDDEALAPSNLNLARIVPIYPLSENLSIKTLRKAINSVLETYSEEIETVLPEFLLKKYNIMEKREALRQIHFPDTKEKLDIARFSLVFEEFFLIQLKLALLREENNKNLASIPLEIKKDGLVMNFINSLPFKLTGAQQRAVNEILADLNSTKPMQRLLQGDVGSGKTVVATIMLLAAIENGYQAAIMAPTEILAQQHYNNMFKWLNPLGIRVELFLGSIGKKRRQISETNLRNGQVDIAVGTHALIQNSVEFANLGAVVIDEQHRFGVKQRLALRKKSQSPQVLTMTATPIPRTLAITMNGDLDLTIIDELPNGRKPILTYMTNSRKQIADLIRREVAEGRQAYIVYPLIEESETLSAKAATAEKEKWETEVFPEYKIGLLHGKLKNDEKEDVMAKFKNKEYDILVSTTVVEVGVDVPNATVIVIENAERFGLSQLHQLRGRVGRSDLQSYCLLSSGTKSQETRARLEIMTQTNDGFVIAEKDLQIRGPGEFLGTRQSGLPDMIIADIVNDSKILEQARSEAISFVKNYNIEDYPLLKESKGLNFDGDIFNS